MTGLKFLLVTAALLVSTIKAQDLYVPVKGSCSDIEGLREPGAGPEVGAGDYFVQWASFQGGRCVIGYCVKRGVKVYGDMWMLPGEATESKDYVFFKNDMTFNPDTKTYTDQHGATGTVLAMDPKSYIIMAQCLQDGDQSKLGLMMATRTPKATKEAKEAYKKKMAELEEKELLPEMFKVDQKKCPPTLNVDLS